MPTADVGAPARTRGHGGAEYPVLLSKITVPNLPGWAVTRPRIEKLLTEGTRGPLTSVTGLPGGGKTLAIASWATTRSCPCALAWITLDGYDDRPRAFWSYVTAALRRAGVAVPRVPPGTSQDAVDHVFLLRLASVLAGQDPPVVLVLDELHLLTEPATLDGLAYVLRNARPGLRLVVAARADPPLPLHHYRLGGELAEIRADDLAFSVEESGQLLAHHGITLSPATLEGLTGWTEGWAAGLRLAALSLRGHPDPGQFLQELDTEADAITGYLEGEVLNTLPSPVRDMLLRTSILDCVHADLAGELADECGAADGLPALARSNTFVRPIGGGWYRYHSPFAAVLRRQLRIERRGQLPDLYRCAARWYQRNGRLHDAVRYAAESGDWQFAAGMVVDELAVGQLIESRYNQPLAEAFLRMPRDHAWTQPQPLLVLAATGLSAASVEAFIASLALAERILDRLPADAEIPARLAAALVRLALYRRTGELAAATAAAERAESLHEQVAEEVRARHREVRVQVLAGRGALELWAGRLDAAAEFFQAGARSAAACGAYERAECLGYLALLEAWHGRLSRAVERAEDAAEVARSGRGDRAAPIGSAAGVALALVHLQRGDIQEAHGLLMLAEAALRNWPDKLLSALACMVAAQRHLAEGRAAAASEMIYRARQDWAPTPPGWLERKLTVLESRVYAAAGDIPAAVAAARRADPESVPDAAVALATAWLVSGDHRAARQALETAAQNDAAQPIGPAGWLVDARLSYRTGDRSRGRRSLGRAVRLAGPEQVRLPFVMERTWIRQVLRCDSELPRAYGELLEPGPANPVTVSALKGPRQDSQDRPVVVERLSEREREVLTRLSGMLSTAEIAAEMYLSVNTVKTHLRSIYRKLSVADRSEAVRRAQQLDLI